MKAFNTFRPRYPFQTQIDQLEQSSILFKPGPWSSKADSLEIPLQKTTLLASIANVKQDSYKQ